MYFTLELIGTTIGHYYYFLIQNNSIRDTKLLPLVSRYTRETHSSPWFRRHSDQQPWIWWGWSRQPCLHNIPIVLGKDPVSDQQNYRGSRWKEKVLKMKRHNKTKLTKDLENNWQNLRNFISIISPRKWLAKTAAFTYVLHINESISVVFKISKCSCKFFWFSVTVWSDLHAADISLHGTSSLNLVLPIFKYRWHAWTMLLTPSTLTDIVVPHTSWVVKPVIGPRVKI